MNKKIIVKQTNKEANLENFKTFHLFGFLFHSNNLAFAMCNMFLPPLCTSHISRSWVCLSVFWFHPFSKRNVRKDVLGTKNEFNG